ncbi:MAG: DUF6163 family protein [Rhizobiaceae bacterium]
MSVQMSDMHKAPSRTQQIIELLFSIYLRLLSVVFFAAAVYTWMTAIGYWEGDSYRFDTMGVALKIYTAIMAVMLPVACVGLWTTLPWGRVIWFFAIAFQSVTLLRFPEMFVAPMAVLIFHLGCLVVYAVFQLLLFVIAKKE